MNQGKGTCVVGNKVRGSNKLAPNSLPWRSMPSATVHPVGPSYVRVTNQPEQRFNTGAVSDIGRNRVRQKRAGTSTSAVMTRPGRSESGRYAKAGGGYAIN